MLVLTALAGIPRITTETIVLGDYIIPHRVRDHHRALLAFHQPVLQVEVLAWLGLALSKDGRPSYLAQW
jgi:hypothetical protein